MCYKVKDAVDAGLIGVMSFNDDNIIVEPLEVVAFTDVYHYSDGVTWRQHGEVFTVNRNDTFITLKRYGEKIRELITLNADNTDMITDSANDILSSLGIQIIYDEDENWVLGRILSPDEIDALYG